MKKIIVFVVLCGLIITANTSCNSKSKTDGNTETTAVDQTSKEPAQKKYIELAKETNKKMPMPIPGGIRMDKTEALSKTEFKFYYTFTKAPAVSAEEFIRSTKPALTLGLQTVKGDDLDMFKKDKMNLIYAYYTMDGKLFAEIRLTPEDYIND